MYIPDGSTYLKLDNYLRMVVHNKVLLNIEILQYFLNAFLEALTTNAYKY